MVMDNKAAHVQASPFVRTQLKGDGLYSLEALFMELDAVDPANVLILLDDVEVTEGDEITNDLRAMAQPFSLFERATKVQATADALGLLLRASIAGGAVSDDELLRIAPALEDRAWRAGLDVTVGDVYTFMDSLWRCVAAHTTQADWQPDKVPALWRKVEVITPDAPRVWQTQTDYATGDKVHYPDALSPLYWCVQGHMSLAGWEPPKVPALWMQV